MYFKGKYLEDNFIYEDEFDYKAALVDRDYKMVRRSEEVIMKRKDTRMKSNQVDFDSIRQAFNEEELFYMNRVAYYLFKSKLQELSFQ